MHQDVYSRNTVFELRKKNYQFKYTSRNKTIKRPEKSQIAMLKSWAHRLLCALMF